MGECMSREEDASNVEQPQEQEEGHKNVETETGKEAESAISHKNGRKSNTKKSTGDDDDGDNGIDSDRDGPTKRKSGSKNSRKNISISSKSDHSSSTSGDGGQKRKPLTLSMKGGTGGKKGKRNSKGKRDSSNGDVSSTGKNKNKKGKRKSKGGKGGDDDMIDPADILMSKSTPEERQKEVQSTLKWLQNKGNFDHLFDPTGKFRKLDSILPEIPDQTIEDRAIGIENAMDWIRQNELSLDDDEDVIIDQFTKVGSVPITRRTADERINELNDVMNWLQNKGGDDEQNDPTGYYRKLDSILPMKQGQSVEDRARDIEGSLDWLRDKIAPPQEEEEAGRDDSSDKNIDDDNASLAKRKRKKKKGKRSSTSIGSVSTDGTDSDNIEESNRSGNKRKSSKTGEGGHELSNTNDSDENSQEDYKSNSTEEPTDDHESDETSTSPQAKTKRKSKNKGKRISWDSSVHSDKDDYNDSANSDEDDESVTSNRSQGGLDEEALLFLKESPAEVRGDKNVVIDVVRKNGKALEYASEELQNDTEVVKFAVKNFGLALKHAPPELRNDREIASLAIRQCGWALEYAGPDLRNDKKLILIAVSQFGNALQYASPELQNDKDVVLAAIKKNGLALRFASFELRSNKKFMLEVVKIDGVNLQYASRSLRRDKDVVIWALKSTRESLKFAHDDLQGDNDCQQLVSESQHRKLSSAKKRVIALSTRHSFEPKGYSNSTNLISLLQKTDFIGFNYEIYELTEKNKKQSCDPSWTNFDCPCRGTPTTCGFDIPPNSATDNVCWRYSFRCALEDAETSGSFMIQLMEREKPWEGSPSLAEGQEIEEDIAQQVGIKIFQVHRPAIKGTHYLEDTFNERDIAKIVSEIKDWNKSKGRKDMSVCKIRLQR